MPHNSSSSFSLYWHLVWEVELFWTSSAASAHQWPNWTAAGLAVTKDMDQQGQMCAVSLVPSAQNTAPHGSSSCVPKMSSTIDTANSTTNNLVVPKTNHCKKMTWQIQDYYDK